MLVTDAYRGVTTLWRVQNEANKSKRWKTMANGHGTGLTQRTFGGFQQVPDTLWVL